LKNVEAQTLRIVGPYSEISQHGFAWLENPAHTNFKNMWHWHKPGSWVAGWQRLTLAGI